MFQFGRSRRSLTILDQALVSGSNFITGIMLVRGLGLVEFGRFTIAYAILLLANSVQLSFISSPMITLGSLCSTPEERRHFVRGMYGVQLIFCAVATVLALVGTAVYAQHSPFRQRNRFLLPFASRGRRISHAGLAATLLLHRRKSRRIAVERRHQLPRPGGRAGLPLVGARAHA